MVILCVDKRVYSVVCMCLCQIVICEISVSLWQHWAQLELGYTYSIYLMGEGIAVDINPAVFSCNSCKHREP